jgi:hypothetical protein
LSRFEGPFVADAKAFITDAEAAEHDLDTLLDRLAQSVGYGGEADRRQALVCVLSASHGWRKASNMLSGNFPGRPAEATDVSQIGSKK